MKKIGVLVLMLCVIFFSALSTYAADFDKADVIIGSEKTSATQTNQRDVHTVSTSETVTINGQDKSVDVALSLKTTEPKTTAVATGDATPVLLLIAIMALSAVAAIVLIHKKKFGKVMAALLSVAMLLTGFMTSPGTAQALSFSDSNVEVAFTSEILEAFEFDQIVSISGGTFNLTDNNGRTTGFTWVLGNLAKNKSQELVFRLKLKDTVSDSVFGKTMNIAGTSFTIGKGVTPVVFAKTTLKLGLDGFELIYDANGGDSSTVPASELKVRGTYTLTGTKPTHANADDGTAIVFVGWSKTADSKIYSKEDTMPTNLVTEVEIVDANVTVYAVWGYDINGDGEPDVGQTKYQIIYKLNGGTAGPTSPETTVAGSDYPISKTIPTHAAVSGVNVVFWGWTTETTVQSMPYGAGATFPGTKISAGERITISGDMTLTAVWAYDSDGTGPDPDKQSYTVSYNVNGGTGTVSSDTVVTGKQYTLKSGSSLTHDPDNGVDVVFYGWSSVDDDKIYGAGESCGTLITEIASVTESKEVFAVWAYDTDGTGPDPLKTSYTISYNINGGTGTVSSDTVVVSKQYTLKSGSNLTHDPDNGVDVVFYGWSSVDDDKIYGAGESCGTLITEIASVTESKEVYAVWAYDTDGTGPDPLKQSYTISYNVNGGTGTVSSDTVVTGKQYTLKSGSSLTHDPDNGVDVVFYGWSSVDDDKIYGAGESCGTLITEIASVTESKEVFAVWAYDTDGTGPDPLKQSYTISYNINGGTGTVSSDTVVTGKQYTLKSGSSLTHDPDNGVDVVFYGWSSVDDDKIYGAGESCGTLITEIASVTESKEVFAVWAYDTDGTGPDPLKTTYTLTYDINSGSSTAPASVTNLIDGAQVTLFTSPAPTYTGHISGRDVVFVGWSTDDDVVGEIYDAGSKATVTALLAGATVTIDGDDMTVYAVWSYAEGGIPVWDLFKVTFDKNHDDATGWTEANPTYIYVEEGDSVGTLPTAPTRTGYVFAGWNTLAGGGEHTSFGAGTTVSDDNITAYAQWNDVYTITYNNLLNGATHTNPATYTAGTGIASFTAPTGATGGLTFVGWYDALTGGSEVTLLTSAATGNKTLFARWTYTVTLDAQGGAVSPASITITLGDSAAVTYGTLNTPTNTDSTKVFKGWYTAATGGTLVTSASVPATIGNHTLYAQWDDAYTITYSNLLNGATHTNPANYTAGTGIASFTAPTGATGGLTFVGWYDAITGGSQVTSITSSDTGAKTLYARWTYTVTLNPQGGTVSPTSITITLGDSAAVTYGTLNTPTNTDSTKVFKGWYTASTGGTLVTAASVPATIGAHTLYAQWNDVYTITYSNLLNGATHTNPANYTAGTGIASFTAPTGATGGLTFVGWYDAITGGSEVTSITSSDTGAKTLFARWTYTVTLDAQGGTVSPTSITITLGNSATTAYGTLPTPIPASGKAFKGWFTASTGGTLVTATSIPATIGAHTLYAQWNDVYTITYSNMLNGATHTNPANYTAGTGIASFTAPTGATGGLTFVGWYDAITGGSQVTSITSSDTGAKTLYARWTYTVTLDPQGGTVSPTSITITLGNSATTAYGTLPTPIPASGKAFKGWYTASSGGTLVTASSIPATIGAHTLYAQWNDTYTVTYNANGATGGSVPVDSNSPYVSGSLVTVAANTGNLVRTNYTFLGWSTNSSAITPTYTVSGSVVTPPTFSISANTTLYAIWQSAPAVITNYTVGATNGNPASQTLTAAGSKSISVTVQRSTTASQRVDLTSAVTGTNVIDESIWSATGQTTWLSSTADAKNNYVTVPQNAAANSQIVVTAKAKSNPAFVVVITITVVDYTLFYSEGMMLYGAAADTETTSKATNFVINMTSPVGASTIRYFTTRNAANSLNYSVAAANWTLSGDGITGTVTAASAITQANANTGTFTNVAFVTNTANQMYGLAVKQGYTGTFTMTVGGYTVIFNVVANRALSSTLKSGDTFKDGSVEWRVLTTDGSGNKLITTEHIHGYGTVYNSSSASAGTKTNDYSTFASSNLKVQMDGWWSTNGSGLQSKALKPTHMTAENGDVVPWSGWSAGANVAAARNAAGASAGGDTTGVVFVLSLSEVNQYFADNNVVRIARDMAGSVQDWWLRSPGNNHASIVSYVSTGGGRGSAANAYSSTLGFRPALWVNP